MPRQARIDAPGALHHIIVRGIEKCNIFNDDIDRKRFVQRLGDILNASQTPCYAWALLPNHFHLLLKTSHTPIATIMRRLLTGHAVYFNRRHRRSGHLFQNRYKSILCQEDNYLLELVRYIHLNPLRANQVSGLKNLDLYPYSGHSVLLGHYKNDWQSVDETLKLFGKKATKARKRYRKFVKKGVNQGRRPELVGGGLIRSVGGWHAFRALDRTDAHFKSDERILGDSDFVEKVLKKAEEKRERKYQLEAEGFTVDRVANRVASIMDLKTEDVWKKGKHPQIVKARSLLCYWAVHELGMTATELAIRIGLTQSAISQSVKRGEVLAAENGFKLIEPEKLII
ncbi:MAG: transposase [Deltaproteobacteria bacterium]|jgi:REP element-mobilizing transposase RayT|nr:transposase [Deltaproteobacteria bacterium]